MPPLKRSGRPRLDPDDRTVYVGVSMTGERFDAIAKRALEAQVSVPEIIRRDLRSVAEAEKEGKT